MSSPSVESLYDQTYFTYQKGHADFGGWANLPKFLPFLREDDVVLDFGCGGGFLLERLPQKKKIGIEINPAARDYAAALGITVYHSASELLDESIDIIISEHALEHCARPLDELLMLVPKLRPGGRMLFYVPSESSRHQYSENDPNHHLYTWSPMNLGNLFKAAGLRVIFANSYDHRWPPYHRQIARHFGRGGFEIAARLYGLWKRREMSQSRCLAIKEPAA